MADKIRNAYKHSKNIYDTILTGDSFFSRIYLKLFWSGIDDNKIAKSVLSNIPDNFSGELLDIPVGTAVFTYEKWISLKYAHITCMDYSEDMLEQARKRMQYYSHISLVQGDVGNLPMDSNLFDIVLCMNGFHVFPDKKKSFEDTCRVLKTGGILIGCFYIRGKSKITDWLVNTILSKKGWFNPPFYTEEELKQVLNALYSSVYLNVEGSMAYFKCIL